MITVGPSLFPYNLAKVFTYVRQKLGRLNEDKMELVNMTASMKAAVHLGKFMKIICVLRRT